MTKFCKDCRHKFGYMCIHPTVSEVVVDIVDGTSTVEGRGCIIVRHDTKLPIYGDYFGACGPDAVLFEPKYTFKEKFMARLNWWFGKDYEIGALK